MPLINELQKIGLLEKEAKVYLAALELGQSSVIKIAQKAGLNRVTVYDILDALIKKGLCSTYHHDKKTYYIAEHPECLNRLFGLRIKEIKEKQKDLTRIMSQLSSIYNIREDKPVVRFFEGKEGILTMINELIVSGAKISRMVYSVDEVRRVLTGKERDEARLRRIQKGVKTKVLYTLKEGVLKSTLDGERIKISEKDFPITCDIALFNNRVRIAALGKRLSGIIIHDEDIYKTLVSIFELAWEAAKARSKKIK